MPEIQPNMPTKNPSWLKQAKEYGIRLVPLSESEYASTLGLQTSSQEVTSTLVAEASRAPGTQTTNTTSQKALSKQPRRIQKPKPKDKPSTRKQTVDPRELAARERMKAIMIKCGDLKAPNEATTIKQNTSLGPNARPHPVVRHELVKQSENKGNMTPLSLASKLLSSDAPSQAPSLLSAGPTTAICQQTTSRTTPHLGNRVASSRKKTQPLSLTVPSLFTTSRPLDHEEENAPSSSKPGILPIRTEAISKRTTLASHTTVLNPPTGITNHHYNIDSNSVVGSRNLGSLSVPESPQQVGNIELEYDEDNEDWDMGEGFEEFDMVSATPEKDHVTKNQTPSGMSNPKADRESQLPRNSTTQLALCGPESQPLSLQNTASLLLEYEISQILEIQLVQQQPLIPVENSKDEVPWFEDLISLNYLPTSLWADLEQSISKLETSAIQETLSQKEQTNWNDFLDLSQLSDDDESIHSDLCDYLNKINPFEMEIYSISNEKKIQKDPGLQMHPPRSNGPKTAGCNSSIKQKREGNNGSDYDNDILIDRNKITFLSTMLSGQVLSPRSFYNCPTYECPASIEKATFNYNFQGNDFVPLNQSEWQTVETQLAPLAPPEPVATIDPISLIGRPSLEDKYPLRKTGRNLI